MIYEIAGLRVWLQNEYAYTTNFCQGYVSDDQSPFFDVVVSVTEEERREEKTSSPSASDGYIENRCLYRNLCLQIPLFDRILLHAAILRCEENGYAFLGRSGVGKSTHTGLWLSLVDDTEIVNGDKPIIAYENGVFTAYGTPWMGKEKRGSKTNVELKALCFVEQAENNECVKLTKAEALQRLLTQVLIPKEEEAVVKTLELADKLLHTLPAYLLRCNVSEAAVKTAYEALTGRLYSKKE